MPHIHLRDLSNALRPREKLLQVSHQFRHPKIFRKEDDLAGVMSDFQTI